MSTWYCLRPGFAPPTWAAPAIPPPQPPPPPQTKGAAPRPTLHRCCSPPQWLPAANPPTTRSAPKRSQQPVSSAPHRVVAEASVPARSAPALRGPLSIEDRAFQKRSFCLTEVLRSNIESACSADQRRHSNQIRNLRYLQARTWEVFQ